MRIVIDTNIFISSFFGGNPRKIINLWKTGKVTLCLSKNILDEYFEVLARIGLRGESEYEELLSLFKKSINIVFTHKTPYLRVVEKDHDDDIFIECAVALDAEAIVTGDKDFLDVKQYKGIKIVTPRKFLEEVFKK